MPPFRKGKSLMKTTVIVTALILALVISSLSAASTETGFFETETKLTASGAVIITGDAFGRSVALSGNMALVGADRDAHAGQISGAAYLFDVTTGNQIAKITASDAMLINRFGASVAINGNTALIGAPHDFRRGSSSGSAYLFDVTTGNQIAKLTASDAAAGDLFGVSVAISGNTALVGALVGANGGLNSDSGSAYLFDVTTGNQIAKLTASDVTLNDRFGRSVAISGNTALVGAPHPFEEGISFGSAYLFDITTGNQIAKLTASDAALDDQFGWSVAISGNMALVGAFRNDDEGSNSGSAYLFDVTTGNQIAKLTASDALAGDFFGASVAINGNTALVGAPGSSSGSAYLFDVATGNQITKITASDASTSDFFGISVAISGNAALVGAFGGFFGSAYLYTTIPEPSSFLLATLAGFLGLGSTQRRRRK